MSITAEQVADLREGDVVELRHPGWQGGVVTGPVYPGGSGPWVASHQLVGGPWASLLQVTVVSRAPRPLYVNHPRTEPVPGDVVTLADHVHVTGEYQPTWFWPEQGHWHGTYSAKAIHGAMPARLRLLVDGETGLPPAVSE